MKFQVSISFVDKSCLGEWLNSIICYFSEALFTSQPNPETCLAEHDGRDCVPYENQIEILPQIMGSDINIEFSKQTD